MIVLLWPIGWNLNVGSPYLGIPSLIAYLRQRGIECTALDLNLWFAKEQGWVITEEEARKACRPSISSALQMARMNKVWFGVEDRMTELGQKYEAEGNIQLGFKFKRFSHRISSEVLEAAYADSPFENFYRHSVIPKLKSLGARLVGFSLASPWQLIPTFQLCRIIREELPETKIIVGGNIISRLRDALPKNPEIFKLADYFGIFQGEETISLLAKYLRGEIDIRSVPGIIANIRGEIMVTAPTESLAVGQLPTPDFSDFPVGGYWGANYLPLLMARGCYYGKCSFCAIHLAWNSKGFVGIRSPNDVLDDMLKLYRRYPSVGGRIKFTDEAIPPAGAKKLSEMIYERRLPLEWESYAIMEKSFTAPSFVEILAKGGCRKFYFGLETTSHEGRMLMKKRGLADPLETLKACYGAGIKVHFFVMVGFPGTGRKEALETVEFVLKNKHMIDTVDVFHFDLMKHTTVERVEAVLDPREDWALDFYYKPTKSGILNREEVLRLWEECEDLVYEEVPALRHPLSRLISPWCRQKSTGKEVNFYGSETKEIQEETAAA